MLKIVSSDPEIMGGTPVFNGTRVPVQTLFDYLAAGDTANDFLDDFPTVSKELLAGAFAKMREGLLAAATAK